jgi:HlyD family secretion protein
VGIGSVVKRGDVLGQIDTSLYKSQLEQQKAQLDAAQADATRARANASYLSEEERRQEKLVASEIANEAGLAQARSARAVAQAEVSAAEGRARLAAAALDQARNSLRWATIVAPVDGTVVSVNHRVGERIRGSDFAEDVVLTLGSLDRVEIRLEVGELDVVHIAPGQAATVELDALPDKMFHGKVIDRGREAIIKNQGTENEVTTFPVWVSLDDPPPDMLSGMSAQVMISTETHDGVVAVPIQAVTVRPAEGEAAPPVAAPDDPRTRPGRRAKLDKVVFVVADDRIAKRIVQTGLSSETDVEITAGLAEGEVVVEGPYRVLARELADGMAVAPEAAGAGGGEGPAAPAAGSAAAKAGGS